MLLTSSPRAWELLTDLSTNGFTTLLLMRVAVRWFQVDLRSFSSFAFGCDELSKGLITATEPTLEGGRVLALSFATSSFSRNSAMRVSWVSRDYHECSPLQAAAFPHLGE